MANFNVDITFLLSESKSPERGSIVFPDNSIDLNAFIRPQPCCLFS
jgi:hypothetical protein